MRRTVVVAVFMAAWMIGPVLRVHDAPAPPPVPQPSPTITVGR